MSDHKTDDTSTGKDAAQVKKTYFIDNTEAAEMFERLMAGKSSYTIEELSEAGDKLNNWVAADIANSRKGKSIKLPRTSDALPLSSTGRSVGYHR
jgi:hypothetical protein